MSDSLGTRLKLARDRKALTLDELTGASGVAKTTIVHIEKDRYSRTPNRGTVRRLAEVLDVDPGWLLTGDLPVTRDGAHDV